MKKTKKNRFDVNEFDEEKKDWIREGILAKYRPSHGTSQRFSQPLLFGKREAVSARFAVFDYRLLREFIESHPGGAVALCAARLRKWRQRGRHRAVQD